MYAAYLDKLETTGRFSSGTMDCLRRFTDLLRKHHQNPAAYQLSDEQSIQVCRGGQQMVRDAMQKAEEIPNLSQAEFDADWGGVCRY
jgi:hypothetical protein